MMPMARRVFPLLLILFIGAFLRFHGIARDPMWLDEIDSLQVSTGRGQMHMVLPVGKPFDLPALTSLDGVPPLSAIWTSMNLDQHPPLYFILLRVWRDIFGEGEAAARVLSAVASLGAIVLIYDAVRNATLKYPAAALWAATLMTVAPAQIRFAQ